ncbi:hypothetical protein WJX73_004256 [Symbiochloris irregularis]|uniref:Uncharacterized protein n=1 Tax=Symbiochloris irregularis TaxID=706552 RepID=A0AAW1NJV8_9CHLO
MNNILSRGSCTNHFSRAGRRRHEDLLVREVRETLASCCLPAYLHVRLEIVMASRSGRKMAYLNRFVANNLENSHHAFKLAQQAQDPSLTAFACERVRAEMTVAAAVNRACVSAAQRNDPHQYAQACIALMQSNVLCPMSTVLGALTAQVDYMQLSSHQMAHLADLGIKLLEQLRMLNAGGNNEDTLHLPISPDARISVRAANMLAVGSRIAECQVQLCGEEWLSDEQLLRWQSKAPDSPVIPNLYPLMLIVVDACLKPRAPRLPLPHSARNDLEQHSSVRHPHKRARCSSPGTSAQHGSHTLARLAYQPSAEADHSSGHSNEHIRSNGNSSAQQDDYQAWQSDPMSGGDLSADGSDFRQSVSQRCGNCGQMGSDVSVDLMLDGVASEQMLAELDTAAICPPLTDLLAEMFPGDVMLPFPEDVEEVLAFDQNLFQLEKLSSARSTATAASLPRGHQHTQEAHVVAFAGSEQSSGQPSVLLSGWGYESAMNSQSVEGELEK